MSSSSRSPRSRSSPGTAGGLYSCRIAAPASLMIRLLSNIASGSSSPAKTNSHSLQPLTLVRCSHSQSFAAATHTRSLQQTPVAGTRSNHAHTTNSSRSIVGRESPAGLVCWLCMYSANTSRLTWRHSERQRQGERQR